MGEQSIARADDKPQQSENHDASEKLRLSLTTSELVNNPSGGIKSNSDKTLESIAQYKAGRYALVTAEGLSLLPSGVLNGVKHNWDNPGEFATKMGTAAVIGAGMRLLLPQAGAARAVVGTVMTYMMAKDAVTPVLNAWGQVSDNSSVANIHDAATNMSNGLGLFTVDMAAGLPIGLAADKLTGYGLKNTATGRGFEAWKDNFYGVDKTGGGLLGARSKDGMSMEEKLKSIKDGSGDQRPLTVDEKLQLIKDNLDHDHVAASNMTPDAEAAFKAYLEHKKWHKTEMSDQIDQLLVGQAAETGYRAKPDLLNPSLLKASDAGTGAGGKPEANGTPESKGTTGGDTGNKGGDAGDIKFPKSGDAGAEKGPDLKPRIVDKNAATVAQMSTTVRDLAAKVSETDMKIANFKESVQSPLTQAMREGPPPLDQGHFGNNKALIELTQQIETPEHVKQAGFLLEHHRVANVQMGIPEQMPEIVDLNQYSRSVHKNLMDLMEKNGIDPSTVLRGTNSPVFLIFDSNGSGPYTIPAIKGVTDTPVVVVPREYRDMLGVHVSGVYSHELGHDLIYGDLLRFPDSLREHVLNQDVVAAVMKQKGITDNMVDVPGVGELKKSEFFTKLLLAEANENTADIFGTSIDPNTPLSLATLLGSLRKPLPGAPKGAAGALETRSMYGQEFVDETSNPLGIEPHGIDSWRVKLGAEVLRQLSKNDAKVSAHADSLDKLADQLRRPGDNYVWASMDNQGKFISIPIKEWDAIIPGIVKAQLETPLPALNNKALRDVYPDMTKIFPRVDGLADKFAASAAKGEATIPNYDKTVHPIEDIYSAGLSGWMKALANNPAEGQPGHVAPDVLLHNINNISGSLTKLYRGDNFLPAQNFTPPSGPFNFASIVTQPAGYIGRNIESMTTAHPSLHWALDNWTAKTSIGSGMALTRNMFDNERKLQEVMKQQKTGS